jgi:hypothetical protein
MDKVSEEIQHHEKLLMVGMFNLSCIMNFVRRNVLNMEYHNGFLVSAWIEEHYCEFSIKENEKRTY